MMHHVVGKIRKSPSNEIWVVLTDFTGSPRLDVREYFHAGGDAGFRPTRKGVSVPVDQIPALCDAIDALASAKELGTVATFGRTGRTEIQAGLRKFEGHTYAELRLFARGGDAGEYRPTPKGITLHPSLVPTLGDAVADAEDLAKETPEALAGNTPTHR